MSIINFVNGSSKGFDKTAHLCSLIKAFTAHLCDIIIIIIIIIIGFLLTCRCRSIFHISGPPLAAHRADLTLGKTAICIFVANFYGRMPFLSPTQTLSAVQELLLFPTDLGCVLQHWHHELVALFRWTTTTAPGSRHVDSRCEATVTQVVTG